MPQTAAQDQRLPREAAAFDGRYAAEAARGIQPLSDFDKARYADPPADTVFPREYFYHLLAPLEGKAVLEIACGQGIDASICAHNGAAVYAYDVSAQSVEIARQRAWVNQFQHRVNVQATGDFSRAFPGQTFDRIIGCAALHRLSQESLAHQVHARLRPGGVAVFAEPVANSRLLQALRRRLPRSIFPATDGERPFNDARIADFARPFDRVERREFQCLGRTWPMFPGNRPLAAGLHKIDARLMRWKFLRRFATVAVFALYRDG